MSAGLVVAVAGMVGTLLWLAGLWILTRQFRELWAFESTTGEVLDTDSVPAERGWWSGVGVAPSPDGEVTPHVEYRYTVDGTHYTRDRLWPAGIEPVVESLLYGSNGFARQVLGQYVPGEAVTVHYDPENPGVSFLRADPNVGGAMALFVIGTAPLSYVLWITVA
jgi:hypothetical protein